MEVFNEWKDRKKYDFCSYIQVGSLIFLENIFQLYVCTEWGKISRESSNNAREKFREL